MSEQDQVNILYLLWLFFLTVYTIIFKEDLKRKQQVKQE